jgi:hypothetical protein
MDTKHKLTGRLKVNAYKALPCEVQLHISTLEDDPWAGYSNKKKAAHPENEYIDGVRALGELSFVDQNSSPMKISKGTGAGLSETVTLDVFYEDEPGVSSRLDIVFLEKTASQRVGTNFHETTHYWQFMVHKKPVADTLGLFPEDFTGCNQLKVYTCCDFKDSFRGATAVVVAKNPKEARQLICERIKALGLPLEGNETFSVVRVDTSKAGCVILHDGTF